VQELLSFISSQVTIISGRFVTPTAAAAIRKSWDQTSEKSEGRSGSETSNQGEIIQAYTLVGVQFQTFPCMADLGVWFIFLTPQSHTVTTDFCRSLSYWQFSSAVTWPQAALG